MAIGRVLFALVVVCVAGVLAGEKHHYSEHEEVPLYVVKIGPYANPSETYSFYHLPFCSPPNIQHKHESLGEVLEGDDMQSSVYDLRFLVNIQWQVLCKVHLQSAELAQFKKAIEEYYYFEMLYDDLSMWGFIGAYEKEQDPPRHYMFTHMHFNIAYNGDQIIQINVTSDRNQVVELADSEQVIEFSYSAKWIPTNIPFEKRLERYREYNFFPRELEIHWMSILNSVALVVLLIGFVAIIMYRILRNDYNRYSKDGTDEADPEDYGWKLIHGDVFRFPPYSSLFCSILGTGAQFLTMAFCVLFLAIVGVFYPTNRGAMQTAALILYALTSVVSGYVSASMYKKMQGEKWVWNVIQTACLFAVPFFIVWFVLNTIAAVYVSTSALPITTIIIIFCIWSFIGFPLTVIGGIAGRNSADPFYAPCRTKLAVREVPPVPWYRQQVVQMLMAGFLPFSAIYIELFYIFSSLWGHKPYTLYYILFLVFLILIIVTACITVALTYFQLATEDHRWWWRSLLSGGSTAFFVYGYSVFYYYFRSDMSGTLQRGFYFGYMLMACYGFFFMLGTVGFYASLVFIRLIYWNLKLD